MRLPSPTMAYSLYMRMRPRKQAGISMKPLKGTTFPLWTRWGEVLDYRIPLHFRHLSMSILMTLCAWVYRKLRLCIVPRSGREIYLNLWAMNKNHMSCMQPPLRWRSQIETYRLSALLMVKARNRNQPFEIHIMTYYFKTDVCVGGFHVIKVLDA